MAIDIRTLAIVNLLVQLALIGFVFGAVYLARKGRVIRHCTIVRCAIIAQIISILAIMLPSLIGIFVYINLEVGRVVHPLVKRKSVMRLALGIWLVALALGINTFLTIYYA